MPNIIPPDAFIEWATDGAADKAKPGNIFQYFDGFQTGATTATNSNLNYAANLVTRWAKFNAQVNAAEIAVSNAEYSEANPLWTGAGAMAVHIRWDELADKWYATIANATSGADVDVFDSDDGETWGSAKSLVTADSNDESCAGVWTNGTVCATATTEHSGPTAYFWVSTDLTVANMAKAAGAFNNIAYVRDMLYDQESSRWYVLGINSAQTSGYIESSGDLGANWTVEKTSINNLRAFATDQAGQCVAVADDSGTFHYCGPASGGMDGTWFDGAAGNSCRGVKYLPHCALYVTVSAGGNCQVIHPKFISAAPIDTDYDFDMLAFSADTAVFEGDAGIRSSTGTWYTFNQSGIEAQDLNVEILPTLRYSASRDWDAEASFEGGQGKLIYIQGASNKLVVMRYGPTGG